VKRSPLVVALLAAAAAVAVLHVARYAFPQTFLGGKAAEHPLLVTASWIKLICLAAATWFAWRCVGFLDRGNPARTPWLTLSVALAAFTLGQGTLTYYQTFRGVSPFPSFADIWFVLSYPLLIIALVWFMTAYAKSGFVMSGMAPLAGALTVIAAAAAWPLLRPIAATPAPPLATALNIAYPALDLVLLIPTIVLLRLASGFRGGAVWRLWAAMLAGFVFIALGDLAFAYFSSFGYTHLDPIVHALYVVAYASLAAGVHVQYELLAPEEAPGNTAASLTA
jgi:hypothetical protein